MCCAADLSIKCEGVATLVLYCLHCSMPLWGGRGWSDDGQSYQKDSRWKGDDQKNASWQGKDWSNNSSSTWSSSAGSTRVPVPPVGPPPQPEAKAMPQARSAPPCPQPARVTRARTNPLDDIFGPPPMSPGLPSPMSPRPPPGPPPALPAAPASQMMDESKDLKNLVATLRSELQVAKDNSLASRKRLADAIDSKKAIFEEWQADFEVSITYKEDLEQEFKHYWLESDQSMTEDLHEHHEKFKAELADQEESEERSIDALKSEFRELDTTMRSEFLEYADREHDLRMEADQQKWDLEDLKRVLAVKLERQAQPGPQDSSSSGVVDCGFSDQPPAIDVSQTIKDLQQEASKALLPERLMRLSKERSEGLTEIRTLVKERDAARLGEAQARELFWYAGQMEADREQMQNVLGRRESNNSHMEKLIQDLSSAVNETTDHLAREREFASEYTELVRPN